MTNDYILTIWLNAWLIVLTFNMIFLSWFSLSDYIYAFSFIHNFHFLDKNILTQYSMQLLAKWCAFGLYPLTTILSPIYIILTYPFLNFIFLFSAHFSYRKFEFYDVMYHFHKQETLQSNDYFFVLLGLCLLQFCYIFLTDSWIRK